VLSGKRQAIGPELKRMRDQNINAVGLLLAFERRAAQLAGLNARLGTNGDPGALIDAEAAARRIFWKDKPALGVQLRIWRGNRLQRLVARLVAMHQSLLANSQDADLLLAEGLVEIARISTLDGKQRIKRTG